MGISIGTHTNGDTLCHHLQHRGASDCIALVGLRVVDHHGAGLFDDVHLSRADMNAMAKQGLLSQNAVVQQTVYRTAAVVSQTVVDIIHTLSYMDMKTGHAIVCLYHLLEGLV